MTVDIMHHEASYMLISVVMRHYKHIIMHYDCRYDALWMWALSKVLPNSTINDQVSLSLLSRLIGYYQFVLCTLV